MKVEYNFKDISKYKQNLDSSWKDSWWTRFGGKLVSWSVTLSRAKLKKRLLKKLDIHKNFYTQTHLNIANKIAFVKKNKALQSNHLQDLRWERFILKNSCARLRSWLTMVICNWVQSMLTKLRSKTRTW